MVRSLSGFAALALALLTASSASATIDYVSSASELVNCIQGTAAARPTACVIQDELVVTTRGTTAITNGVIGATLPSAYKFDLEIRFEAPGCLVWNHLNAFPYTGDPTSSVTSPVEVLKLLAPVIADGSRLRIKNPCLREQRNGINGGDAVTVVNGFSLTGLQSSEVMALVTSTDGIRLASTGAGTRDVRGFSVGTEGEPISQAMPPLVGIGSSKSGRGLFIVDLLTMGSTNGPVPDTNGSIFDLGCATGADDPNDGPCANLNDANQLFGVGAGAQFANTISIDAGGLGAKQLCRRTLTPFEYGTGAGFETNMDSMSNRTWYVLRRNSDDNYLLGTLDSQGFDCVNNTGTANLRTNVGYAVNASDDAMLFVNDGVHPTTYGMRWIARQLLEARVEFQYPAILGVPNLFGDAAYGETTGDCTTTWTATLAPTITSTATVPTNNDAAALNPIVGQGCEFNTPAASSTASSVEKPVEPNTWYYAQFFYNANTVSASNALIFDVVAENVGGTAVPTLAERWFGDGPAFGEIQELTGALAQPLQTRMAYGGILARVIFKTPETADHVRIDVTSGAAGAYSIDDLFLVKKLHQDREFHYLIPDGAARFKVISDSRGIDTSQDRLPQAIDYMLGIVNPRGLVRATSIRPGLNLLEPSSSSMYAVGGGRLSTLVGPIDGEVDYAGNPLPFTLGDVLDGSSPTYCIALFGVNDWLQGLRSSAQPTRRLGFPDQIRGFEQYAERAGCVPILIQDYMARGPIDTATYPALRDCSDGSGTAENCATNYRTLWKNVLQSGVPR
jgi:hypothetical protein